jgi:hypothetical protein
MDEKHLREKYGIDNEDWEKTPVSVRQIVLLLISRIEELEGHCKEIKDLKEQPYEKITRNSENSHSPPSADPIDFQSRRKKKPKGKKRGGQPEATLVINTARIRILENLRLSEEKAEELLRRSRGEGVFGFLPCTLHPAPMQSPPRFWA